MSKDSTLPSSGTITRMTLLGLLAQRPMHGYDLRQELERRLMDQWADIRFGSIYSGLQRLEAAGLVEELERVRMGRRPPRTVYQVTAAGLETLRDLVREHLTCPSFQSDPIDVALSFCFCLHYDELEELFVERLGQLDDALERLERKVRDAGHELPAHQAMIEDLVEHSRSRIETERTWTERVLERIRMGLYRPDRPFIEKWEVSS